MSPRSLSVAYGFLANINSEYFRSICFHQTDHLSFKEKKEQAMSAFAEQKIHRSSRQRT